jgi:hypothetical protein
MAATKPNETSTPAPGPTGKRVARAQASVLLSPKARALVEQITREEDCSFGRAMETIVDRYALYRQTILDMRAVVGGLQGAENMLIETILFQRGWTSIRVVAGTPPQKGIRLWAPPGTPFPILEFEKIT